MTTTLDVSKAAQELLIRAADIIAASKPERFHHLHVHDAFAAAATDALPRIVAERVFSTAGFDLAWHFSDPSPKDAEEGMRAVGSQPIDLTQHYGKNSAALMGILRACIDATEQQLYAVGHQLRGFEDELWDFVFTQADALGVSGMLADVCSDVHFACDENKVPAESAAARLAHLKGVRGFELAAAYYVLEGAEATNEQMHQLLGPLLRTFFPDGRLA